MLEPFTTYAAIMWRMWKKKKERTEHLPSFFFLLEVVKKNGIYVNPPSDLQGRTRLTVIVPVSALQIL
jgi:hypothetical protein